MIDLDRLKSNLMTSGLQQKDNALFQVIKDLIDALRQFILELQSGGITPSGGSGTTIINKRTIQIVEQDDSVEETTFIIQQSSSSPSVDREWSVLTNGDVDYPELVFANGDVIMTHTP